ncbi:MAG TPA: hypothetical protein DCS97_01220 [Planctomycetes bacterium]|nr:hypothetical protein [Planctomycetota bacterium]
MTTPKSHIEIAYSSIRVFTDDGQMDLAELNFLLGLALRDGVVDADEKRVLGNITRKALMAKPSPVVEQRILAVMKQHSL